MKTEKSTGPHMTGQEAADYLRCSTDTVRRYAREGKLTRVRLSPRKILYLREEIEDLVEKSSYRIGA